MTSTLKKISRRVALTLAVSACFSPVTQAAELLTEGVFKVGMEVTYPPFESYDSNNNIVGLDPEFAALIAQHLQAKPQLIDTKFTSLILGIGKKYDAVISGMYVTPERQKQADAILAEGKTAAEAERQHKLREADAQTTALARAMCEKLLSRNLTEQDDSRLLDDLLEKAGAEHGN